MEVSDLKKGVLHLRWSPEAAVREVSEVKCQVVLLEGTREEGLDVRRKVGPMCVCSDGVGKKLREVTPEVGSQSASGTPMGQ
jgi:hypothetical protein